jgi:hypothetical protein
VRGGRVCARTHAWQWTHAAAALPSGGLDELVTEAVLHAAFLPFGEIKDVSVPVDHGTQKNRGFGFVTFQEKCARSVQTRNPDFLPPLTACSAPVSPLREDCAAAMDNMHNAELYGRVRCAVTRVCRLAGRLGVLRYCVFTHWRRTPVSALARAALTLTSRAP